MSEINNIIFIAFENLYPLQSLDFVQCKNTTITMLNTVSIIPMYVRVLHLELISSGLEFAATSFILCNIKLATSVLICLCLPNR